MYRVIITGTPDVFSESSMARNFTRRGLIRFLFRHANKLAGYDYVAVSRGYGPALPVNFWFVRKKHMNDCIPTNLHIRLKHMSDRIPTNQLIHLK